MRIAKKFQIAAASLVVAVGALIALNATGTTTQAVSSFRNCNDDAIIRCGAVTEAELLKYYDENKGDVQNIYKHYGITRGDLAGTSSTIKHGTVDRQGNVYVDGKVVATGAYSVSRVKYTSAGEPRTVVINGKTYYEGPSMAIFTGSVDAFVYMRDGKFHKAVLSSCANPLIATPTPEPPKKPVFTCEALQAKELSRDRYRFTASASASNGARIVNYTFNFGDGTIENSDSNVIEHDFAPGTYTITVVANVNVNGEMKIAASENCKTRITVKEEPKTPIYECTNLTAQPITNKARTFAYTLTYKAEGGATLDEVTYNFGDGNSETFTNEGTSATNVEHQYANPGTYKTVATLYFTVKNGLKTTVETKSCEVEVTVPKPDNCPLPGKEQYPKDSPECLPCPTNPNLPKDSPKCVPCPTNPELPSDSDKCGETPPELPKTGIDMFIGGSLGLGSISAAGLYWSASRRSLLDALLKK